MGTQSGLMRRRNLLKMGLAATIPPLVWSAKQVYASDVAGHPAATPSMTPDAALKELLQGNQRFVNHTPKYPHQSAKRVQEVAKGQHPFVAVLSCADSRVPAEIIFDQGVGDIFDVRIAGNIATPEAMGSIEYAVELLGSPLLLVLGHERCGAVTAAVKQEELPGHISTFVKAIQPALASVAAQPGDPVENAVIANIKYQIQQLLQSPIIQARSQAGTLKVIGGRYDLDTGRVTLVT